MIANQLFFDRFPFRGEIAPKYAEVPVGSLRDALIIRHPRLHALDRNASSFNRVDIGNSKNLGYSKRSLYYPRPEQQSVRPGEIIVPLFSGHFAIDTPGDPLGREAGNGVRDLPLVELGDSLLQLWIVQDCRIRILEMDEDAQVLGTREHCLGIRPDPADDAAPSR